MPKEQFPTLLILKLPKKTTDRASAPVEEPNPVRSIPLMDAWRIDRRKRRIQRNEDKALEKNHDKNEMNCSVTNRQPFLNLSWSWRSKTKAKSSSKTKWKIMCMA